MKSLRIDNHSTPRRWILGAFLMVLLQVAPAAADIKVQCPGDLNGDAIPDVADPEHPQMKCMHLGAGDGFLRIDRKSVV